MTLFALLASQGIDPNGPAGLTIKAATKQGIKQLTDKVYEDSSNSKSQRIPGNIYLTGHRVMDVGPIHTAIEYVDKNGHVSTISAGPVNGRLVSGINRFTDSQSNNYIIDMVTPPAGKTVKQYYQELINANRYYSGAVDYDTFPEIMDSYNSNSFVHGLLKATGGSTSVDLSEFVGGNKPLPPQYFGPVPWGSHYNFKNGNLHR